jgi:hypothetical protein
MIDGWGIVKITLGHCNPLQDWESIAQTLSPAKKRGVRFAWVIEEL